MRRPPPRLVIIDDDPKLAGLVSTIARESYPDAKDLVIDVVITAEAAVLAIRRISEAHETALVVISDFQLSPSVIHGLDILAEVKRRIPTAKRALMTGRDPEEFDGLLEQARLDAFVSKPFTFDDMQALIQRLVSEVVRETRSPAPLAVEPHARAPRGERGPP
jgi:DNA-binding NtrC family response regulator